MTNHYSALVTLLFLLLACKTSSLLHLSLLRELRRDVTMHDSVDGLMIELVKNEMICFSSIQRLDICNCISVLCIQYCCASIN
jgi:hypothetical protein